MVRLSRGKGEYRRGSTSLGAQRLAKVKPAKDPGKKRTECELGIQGVVMPKKA